MDGALLSEVHKLEHQPSQLERAAKLDEFVSQP